MRAPEVQSAAFPTAHCSACGKTVLTYISTSHISTIDDESESRRCVHCDGDVEQCLEWIGAGDLEDLGYYFGAPPEKSAGGCGSGGGGCGSCSK
jgi:hypothetical protein